MKSIRKELNKMIEELLDEGTITHTQEYPDAPYPGQHSFDEDEEYEEIDEETLTEWKKNFPGFSSKEYDVIQNWIDMVSLSQTIGMYRKNKKSFSQFVKDAAKEKMFEELLDESGILYKAGVKKYGKEGMKKIQQAAGKRKSHAEIGKIKDKYEKGKKNEGGKGSGRPTKAGSKRDIEKRMDKAVSDANAKLDAAEKAAKKKKKNEGKLTEDIGTDTYLGGIAQALKKAGIRYKKATVMKWGMNSKAVVGFYVTIDKEIVLPLEVRKDGYLYYEIEKSIKLGKWADTNKIAQAFKKLSKLDGWGQGKLVKKEGKLTEATDSYVVWSPLLNKVYDGPVSEKKALMLIKKYAKQGQYHVGMLGTKYFNKTKLGKKNPVKEGKLKEGRVRIARDIDADFRGNIVQIISSGGSIGLSKKSFRSLLGLIRQNNMRSFESVIKEGKRFKLPDGIVVELDQFKGVTIYGYQGNKVVLNRKDLAQFLRAAKKNFRIV